MARLSFKKAYIEPIQLGAKTSTLRTSTRLQVNDEVNFTCRWGDPPFAVARIRRISEVSLDAVDDQLARAEGFESAEELRAVLAKLYPEASKFVRIDFEVTG